MFALFIPVNSDRSQHEGTANRLLSHSLLFQFIPSSLHTSGPSSSFPPDLLFPSRILPSLVHLCKRLCCFLCIFVSLGQNNIAEKWLRRNICFYSSGKKEWQCSEKSSDVLSPLFLMVLMQDSQSLIKSYTATKPLNFSYLGFMSIEKNRSRKMHHNIIRLVGEKGIC